MTRSQYQNISNEMGFALVFLDRLKGTREADQAAEHIRQAAQLLEDARVKKPAKGGAA